jgi:hypothetical protein
MVFPSVIGVEYPVGDKGAVHASESVCGLTNAVESPAWHAWEAGLTGEALESDAILVRE